MDFTLVYNFLNIVGIVYTMVPENYVSARYSLVHDLWYYSSKG